MHFPLNFANGWDYHRTINSSWHQRTTKRITFDKAHKTGQTSIGSRILCIPKSSFYLSSSSASKSNQKKGNGKRTWGHSVERRSEISSFVWWRNRVNLSALDSLRIVSVFIRHLLMETYEEKVESALQLNKDVNNYVHGRIKELLAAIQKSEL